LDLAVSTRDGLRFFVNAGGFDFRPFTPVVGEAGAAANGGAAGSPPAPAGGLLASADVNGDGAVDLLIERQSRLIWLTQEAPAGGWLSVSLTGIKNNLRGIGARLEVKAGGYYQMRPLRAAPLHFGVGDARTVDVVRVRWPNGIVQNLLEVDASRAVAVTELERLEGSCPFLYTWDGERWRFINEVLGVAPLGMPLSEGVFHTPDADEYVPVPAEALAARDGRFEIRLTEELRETGYIDAVRLLALDHPTQLSVLPDERFSAPPHPDFRLFLFDELQPVRAIDQEGRDWSRELAAVDGEWAVPFRPGPYDGMATPHALTLDLSAGLAAAGMEDLPQTPPATAAEPVTLFLTGWVYWATGSVNLAADQDPRFDFTPVSLEVPDGAGGWRTAIDDIGLPNAKDTTLAIDLSPYLVRSDPRLRLRTTMRLYWDRIGYTQAGAYPHGVAPAGDWHEAFGVPRSGRLSFAPAVGSPRAVPGSTASSTAAAPLTAPSLSSVPLQVHVLAPESAQLRPRGFSALHRTAEGYETFDYQTVTAEAPWDQHLGFYTRFGPVGELLQAAEDQYVIVGTGDELAIRFNDSLPPVRPGWRRDFLVYLNGWVKDGDLNTAYSDRVEPLPFHRMSGYPYGPDEAYPNDAQHRAFLERYLTRPARPINPPLRGS
ncbi:MAG: CRTAC1 family protein, partial [Acidobacteriota bacterium]